MRRPNLLPILLMAIVLPACRKSGITATQTTANTSGVYVAGYDQQNAVYWKDGKETVLSKTVGSITFQSAVAQAVVVNNGTVYVVGTGTAATGLNTGLIWKNGVLDTLAHIRLFDSQGSQMNTQASAILFSGNDMYVGGRQYSNAYTEGSAILWKNGSPAAFGALGENFSALVLANNDLYATGCIETSHSVLVPHYYKNGVNIPLTSRNFCWVHDLCITDSGVYAVGSDFLVARYWKNGTEMVPSNVGVLNANALIGIAAAGKNIYFIDQTGRFWQNDTLKYIAPQGYAFSKIAVSKKDIYMVGTKDSVNNSQHILRAIIWKNNSPTQLSVFNSEALGIYIVN